MKLTHHAKERMDQRNISDQVINIILNNGSISHVPGGAMKIFFGNKEASRIISELKNTIKMIEHAKGGALIVTHEEALTVYKTY